MLVNGRIVAELGMECRGEDVVFLNDDWIVSTTPDGPNAGAKTSNDGCADEDHFRCPVLTQRTLAALDETVNLPPISIPLDADIEKSQAWLLRVENLFGQKDSSCTGAKDWQVGLAGFDERAQHFLFANGLE